MTQCNLWLNFALHTSLRQKCLKLRCDDFSELADWSPKQTMSCTLVKQASVDLVSDLFGLRAVCYGAQGPDGTPTSVFL